MTKSLIPIPQKCFIDFLPLLPTINNQYMCPFTHNKFLLPKWYTLHPLLSIYVPNATCNLALSYAYKVIVYKQQIQLTPYYIDQFMAFMFQGHVNIKKPFNVEVVCLCYGQASHLVSSGHQMLKCWYPPCIMWSLDAKMLMYQIFKC